MASTQVVLASAATFDKFNAASGRLAKVSTPLVAVKAGLAPASSELQPEFVGWVNAVAKEEEVVLKPEIRSRLSLQLPVIDLRDLTCCNTHSQGLTASIARQRIVKAIGSATEAWGFFQVVNHGVPEDLMDRLLDQAKKFFELPLETKKRAKASDQSSVIRMMGYRETFASAADPIPLKESIAEFTARSVAKSPVADLAAKIWPDGNIEFSDTVEEHCRAAEKLGHLLLELLAESLGLASNFFSKHFQEGADCIGTWRLHRFPVKSAPSNVWRTVSHSDPSVLTILKQDVGGLQVKRVTDNTWIDVNPLKGSFVINVGDILEAWTNGRFPSVDHRVGLDKDIERFSTVNFLDAGPSLYIEAPPELIDEAHPAMYKPFYAGDFREHFEKTKRQGNIQKGVALSHYLRKPVVARK